MGARFRSWWQQIRKHQAASVFIALLVAVSLLVIFGGYKFNWGWTGFNQPSKTLWDWLQLLGVLAVPVVVGFGAVWFTTRQGKVADAENKDNQRETALQAYIDKMSELLLHEKLRESAEKDDEVRNVARVRTFAVLRGLDPVRKGIVILFLSESKLIGIIDLDGVDLEEARLDFANLECANLIMANLERAHLTHAHLEGANLKSAKLSGANLRKAHLNEADLSRADLTDAVVISEQWNTAKSLQGATMPDGSIHP
jgi:hypothetical protein